MSRHKSSNIVFYRVNYKYGSVEISRALLFIAAFFYVMFGAEIMYRYTPGMLAAIEHITNFPPNMCRISNIKALNGNGTVMWGQIYNGNINGVVEHLWGIDSNNKYVDVTCSMRVCKQPYACGKIIINNYRIASVKQLSCPLKQADAKFESLVVYVDYALAVNRFMKAE